MNLDPRQTVLMQTPVGAGVAAWLSGGKQNGVESLERSGDRLAVPLPQGLKGTSPLGDTQAARAENLQDSKLPGLNRLKELSAECGGAVKPATWRDNLFVPEPPSHNVRNMAVGISGGVVAGVLACVLALNYIRNATAESSPQPIPPVHQVSEAVTTTDIKAQETVRNNSAGEMHTHRSDFVPPEAPRKLSGESIPAKRLKSRLAPEVLYRLEPSLEQSARIRTILDRCSSDLPFAEEQIRGLLTEEQNRRWQSIAP